MECTMTEQTQDGQIANRGVEDVSPADAQHATTAPTQPVRRAAPPAEGHGRTIIGEGIVAMIASAAARRAEGVHELLPASPARSLMHRLVSAQDAAGERGRDVSVAMHGSEATIGVRLVVTYGRSLPQVADAVRNAVIQDVEGLTGISVKAVNVEIADLSFPRNTAEEG
jgi:uncharacterized alkaline shock family protein YloU